MLNANITLKKHKDMCGKGIGESEQKREKSREVCIHWKRGKCDRGSQCNFSHVGWQDRPQSKKETTSRTLKPCRNGPDCSYLAKGRCSFGHHDNNVHQARELNKRPNQTKDKVHNRRDRRKETERAPCRFGRDCDRVINCPYIHSMEDFPMLSKSQGVKRTNRSRSTQN